MKFCFVVFLLFWASVVPATVTTTASSVVYVCNGTTTTFAAPFRFTSASDLVVAKIYISPETVTTLTYGTHYTVSGGNPTGSITTTAAGLCYAPFRIRIQRVVATTQTTSFSTQGSFSPKVHEVALDKLAMVDQQVISDLAAAVATEILDVSGLVAADAATLAATINAVAGLNGSGHAVTSTSSVLAYGSTTPRTLAARTNDVVNIYDYGATCTYNPITGVGPSDRVAIQAALVAAEGRSLYIPSNPGGACCMVEKALRVPSNIKIYGDGPGSCLAATRYGWYVRDEAGIGCQDQQNYGVLTVLCKTNVEITGLRLYGAKETTDIDFEHSPLLIDSQGSSNLRIHHNTLEHTHYSVLWGSDNFNIIFSDNYITDAAYVEQDDLMGNLGGGVVQIVGAHSTFTNNIFYKVGYGISATSEYSLITHNQFYDYQGFAVFIGDALKVNEGLVANNIFETTPNLIPAGGRIVAPTAVFIANSSDPWNHATSYKNTISVVNNKMRFVVDNVLTSFFGVSVNGVNAIVRGNSVEMDVQTDLSGGPANNFVGYVWTQGDVAPFVQSESNLFYVYSTTGATNFATALGIVGFLWNGSPALLGGSATIWSTHNIVRGVPATSTAFSEGYGGPGQSPLKAYHFNDYVETGSILIGSQSLPERNVPFGACYDSAIHAVDWQPCGTTHGNVGFDSITYSGSLTATNGVIVLPAGVYFNAAAGVFFRYQENGVPKTEFQNGVIYSQKMCMGAGTGWGWGGPCWSYGSGAPSAADAEGSVYSRTDTGAIYVRHLGAWSLVTAVP